MRTQFCCAGSGHMCRLSLNAASLYLLFPVYSIRHQACQMLPELIARDNAYVRAAQFQILECDHAGGTSTHSAMVFFRYLQPHTAIHSLTPQHPMHCRPLPKPLGILAGTVPCPECAGKPTVYLHGPNLEEVLNLALPWDFQVRSTALCAATILVFHVIQIHKHFVT